MSRQDTKIPIVVSGGIDQSIDEFALEPPNAVKTENLRLNKSGALRKRKGFANFGSVADADSKVVVNGDSSVLVLGDSPAKVVTESGGEYDTTIGAPLPTEVQMERILAGQGFVRDVQLAHKNGITCVAYSVISDPLTNAARFFSSILDFQVEVVVLNEDWEIIWGPYRPPQMSWLPRVEPRSADGSRFDVFALHRNSAPTTEDDVVVISSPFDDDVTLRHFSVDTSSSPSGGGIVLGDVWPMQTSTPSDDDPVYKIYDTANDADNGYSYVVFPYDNSGSQYVRAIRVQAGSNDVRDWSVAYGADNTHIACHYDVDSQTFLVYRSESTELAYFPPDLSGALSSITAPSLVGIDATYSDMAGVDLGPRETSPEFYYVGTSLYLNEVPISLAGSNPATPSAGTAGAERLPATYTPVQANGRTYYFYCGQSSDLDIERATYEGNNADWQPHKFHAADSIEIYHLEDDEDGTTRPVIDSCIAETRLGSHNHRVYTYSSGHAVRETSISRPMVSGQVAVDSDGNLLVPTAILSSIQKNRRSLSDLGRLDPVMSAPRRSRDVGLTVSGLFFDLTDGAGYYNDEQVVAVAKVSTKQVASSDVDLAGSRLIAAGMVSSWAKNQVHPVALRPPKIVSYDIGTTIHISAVGIEDTTTGGTGTVENKWNRAFNARVVLVYTDPSGVEYRSPPSAPFLMENGVGVDANTDGTVSEDEPPDYCPEVQIDLHPQVFSFFGTGRALDAELYVTSRVLDDAPTDILNIDESTYTMVNRMPLNKGNHFVVYDTLQDFNNAPAISVSWVSNEPLVIWNSPPHTNALYTVANELEPDHPPASSTVVQAGDYIFLLPSEAPFELWPSKPLVRGRVPEFNSLLTLQLPAESGGGVSLAGTYDRLYVICKNGVWELPVLGGPDATGSGSFPPFRKIYVGEGAVGHAGTIDTPTGTYYCTTTGPRLLAQSQSRDIGRSVEDALDWTAVQDSVYLPDYDEICWSTEDKSVFFNQTNGVWTTADFGALALGSLGGKLFRAKPVGTSAQFLVEDPDLEDDDGDDLLAVYESPWLKLGDDLGYKRFRRVGLLYRLENAPSDGSLSISLAYNYDDTVVDTFTWTASELAALDVPGHLVVKPSRQKADCVKIIVEEGTTEYAQDQSGNPLFRSNMDWSLVKVELRVAGKLGLMKLEQGAKK